MFLIISGCNEDGGHLGREILPDDDNFKLGYEGNFDITATTQSASVQWTKGVDTLLVGSMDDPVFGRTEASFIVQLIFDEQRPGVFVGENPKIHSPVLNLGYINTYGQEDIYPQLNVYELPEIPDSVNAFSNTNIAEMYKGKLLNAEPSARQGNFIRIPLQESYIQDVLEFMDTDTTLAFIDTTGATLAKFTDLFPGLYIAASPEEGSNTIARISADFVASYISFTVESNVGDSVLQKTLVLPFKHDTIETFRANYIKHDYSNSVVTDSIDKPDAQKFYIQGFDGLEGKITINGLESFRNSVNSDIAVNKATLFIPYDENDNSFGDFPRPYRLMLSFPDGQFLPGSFNPSNSFPASIVYVNRFDGILDKSAGGYHFNISGYIQEYFNGGITSNELIVSIPDLPATRSANSNNIVVQTIRPSMTHPDRVILENSTSGKNITLEVIYNELGK
ncbi:MAG: DUF4270 family protein [Bacteroidetes bacterium]|nr:DUF4270 family protein [Bacteroidota bacterium]